MRKQNSTIKTGFISEAGSELENNDYFAFVELEKYACYVIADGLNELPDARSAKLAIEAVITEFQEHPSITKRAVLSYMNAANRTLGTAEDRERLKASVTVVVTDYACMRYAYAGNTRLRLYRGGNVKEQTEDMSLGQDLGREQNLPEDVLSRHEERNNLYSYAGQGKGFLPAVSKKIKLENGDIIALYTRGIWENLDNGELDDVFSEAKDDPEESLNNIEDLLLSRQPKKLENYTFAAIFVDKVFLDPNRKKRIKKIVTIIITILVVILVISVLLWILARRRQAKIVEMNRSYMNTIEYIQDGNFVRAEEECKKALESAQGLRDEDYIEEISEYLRLIEAVNSADEEYGEGNYGEAQAAYVTAKERSRYADHVADEYIDSRLDRITDYLSVFDYIQLGDMLAAQGDYDRAEEKYLTAKSLATSTYFEQGRQEAMEALQALYASRDAAEEAANQEAADKAASEVSATQLTSEGDRAFAEGDYDSARAYYAMALEKYHELGDTVHAELIQTKMDACDQKSAQNNLRERQAEAYINAAREQDAAGNKMEAEKQYLFAKNIYEELNMDDKVAEIEGLIRIIEIEIQQAGALQGDTGWGG